VLSNWTRSPVATELPGRCPKFVVHRVKNFGAVHRARLSVTIWDSVRGQRFVGERL